MLLDLVLWGVRLTPTTSSLGMLAEFMTYNFSGFHKSDLSASSEAPPRGFVFLLPFPFCIFPKGNVWLRTGKSAILTHEICPLVFVCPSVLSASVGLNSGYPAQSGSLGTAGSCVWGQREGERKGVILQSCKSSAFCQCCILFFFFFYCLLQRSYCCNSTGCKQNPLKFMTGQVAHVAHLWDTCRFTEQLSKNFSLKCNSFHVAWHFSVKEISIFRERFYSKSYIRLCWGDHYCFYYIYIYIYNIWEYNGGEKDLMCICKTGEKKRNKTTQILISYGE